MGYKVSLADYWTLKKGTLVDPKEEIVYEERKKTSTSTASEAKPTVVTGSVGVDAHVIGTKIISKVLRENGFNVVALGAQNAPEEFIKATQETDATAIMITSLYGMAELDLQGFRDKCIEAGIGDVLLYIGGNLGIGKHDFADDEVKFKKLGFDRVYEPNVSIEKSIKDLCEDLIAKGKI